MEYKSSSSGSALKSKLNIIFASQEVDQNQEYY
jgi:hypothetical protein